MQKARSALSAKTNCERGQGAVEYLLIIGAVLLIALMVISILGYFPATAGETVASQSQLYWRGQAKPFSAIDTAYKNQSVCNGTNGTTGVVIAMKNNEKYTLTLSGVFFNDVQHAVCPYENDTGTVAFMPGQEIIVGAVLPIGSPICANRTTDSPKFDIIYSSPYIQNRIQTGAVKLHILCR